MTRDDIRELIRETVLEVLTNLGFDPKNPREVQADLRALREWRLTVRAARHAGVVAGISALVAALGAVVWAGIKVLMP